MTNRRKRRDGNHQAIVTALQRCGWKVIDLSQIGDDTPDLLIARVGRIVLVEVKTPGKTPSPGQQEFLDTWPGETAVLRSIPDVVTLTEARRRA